MPRKKATAEAPPETAKSSEIAKQIGAAKLKRLLSIAANSHKDSQEIAGTLGQKIAHACEHDHLHRKAFATLKAMDRMTPEKLADYWDTLQYYVEISGLGERAASAPAFDLAARRAQGEGGDDPEDPDNPRDEPEAGPGNIKPFPRPIGAPAV
jgi:hypothetical protein